MVTVLKLGGSVITRKAEPETVDEDALDAAVAAVADTVEAGQQLVVVHGGGSFGHHHAENHGVTDSEGTTDASALVEIHDAMGALNEAVVTRLHEAGVAALPVRPLSVACRTQTAGTTSLEFPGEPVGQMIQEGFVPVTHGDVVVDEGNGGTILSGDEIVVSLARRLDAARVGLCSGVPGVLDEEGKVIPSIRPGDDVDDVLGGSDATDVTGGMRGKVDELLALEMPASIFALAELDRFLETGTAGTVVGPKADRG